MAVARKPISKKIRFEVFKRDSFKCQYCGACGPDVLLQVDHIKPVAAGGTNEIVNLITACQPCNAGKGAVPLDDKSVVVKSRRQLEELQARREQFTLMLDWHESLTDLAGQAANRIAAYFEKLAPGTSITPASKQAIKKWLSKYPVDELLQAVEIAANQYLAFDADGRLNLGSIKRAFEKIPKICHVRRASEADPDLQPLFYIRGIIRNRTSGRINEPATLELLRDARKRGVSLDALRDIAATEINWTDFRTEVQLAVERVQDLREIAGPELGPVAHAEGIRETRVHELDITDDALAPLIRLASRHRSFESALTSNRWSTERSLANALMPVDRGPFTKREVGYLNPQAASADLCLPPATPARVFCERRMPDAVILGLHLQNVPWDSTVPGWLQVLSLRADLLFYASVLRSHVHSLEDERKVQLTAEACRENLSSGLAGLDAPAEAYILGAVHRLYRDAVALLWEPFCLPSRELLLAMPTAAQAIAVQLRLPPAPG